MKPRRLLDSIANLSGAFDDDNPSRAGPVMALPVPPDIVHYRHVAGLDTSVIRIDRPVPAYRGVFETFSLLFGNQLRNIGLSGALIAFRRQHVVGLPVDHLLRDAALAAHGADGDNRSYDLQHLRQLGDRDDFVGLRRHLHLTQYQPLAGREGRNPVDRDLAGFLWCDRRTVLPSMAITLSGRPVLAATQATKQRWNATSFKVAKMSPRWSGVGMPSR